MDIVITDPLCSIFIQNIFRGKEGERMRERERQRERETETERERGGDRRKEEIPNRQARNIKGGHIIKKTKMG